MSRIPLFDPADMTPEQRSVYEKIIEGPRTSVIGPLRAALHLPELADRWQQLGEFLRFGSGLPARLNELAILVTARRWNAQLEWDVHERAGRAAGLGTDLMDRIRIGTDPRFDRDDEYEVYEFVRTLQHDGDVPEHAYRAVWDRWGTEGVVALSSVVGYYTMVAMTLNVHRIPLPERTDAASAGPRTDDPLPVGPAPGLTALPPARPPGDPARWGPRADVS